MREVLEAMIQLSDHFKRSVKLLTLLGTLLVGVYFWLRHVIHEVGLPPNVILPKNDSELIKYNENRHIITVTTAKGTIQAYSRNPSVEIRKDGTVKVDDHQWGFEDRPYLGIGYSDVLRAYIGVNGVYLRRFDAGAAFGLASSSTKDFAQPVLTIGYNFWSHTSVMIGLNPVPLIFNQKPQYALLLTVTL